MNRLQGAPGVRDMHRSPNNPYNPPAVGMVMESDETGRGPRHDKAARGLDGPLLDGLLKDRMSEGIVLGHRRGIEEAQLRYGGIFDEGYDQGIRDGKERGAKEHSERLEPTLRLLRREMADLSRLTRGSVIRQRLGLLEDEISYALGDKLRPASP